MNIGEEVSLGIENGVEIFSTVISHNEMHGRFVRLSDNKDIIKFKTIKGDTYMEYFDPDFWTIEFNGKEVQKIPNLNDPVKMAATLGDRIIRIKTK